MVTILEAKQQALEAERQLQELPPPKPFEKSKFLYQKEYKQYQQAQAQRAGVIGTREQEIQQYKQAITGAEQKQQAQQAAISEQASKLSFAKKIVDSGKYKDPGIMKQLSKSERRLVEAVASGREAKINKVLGVYDSGSQQVNIEPFTAYQDPLTKQMYSIDPLKAKVPDYYSPVKVSGKGIPLGVGEQLKLKASQPELFYDVPKFDKFAGVKEFGATAWEAGKTGIIGGVTLAQPKQTKVQPFPKSVVTEKTWMDTTQDWLRYSKGRYETSFGEPIAKIYESPFKETPLPPQVSEFSITGSSATMVSRPLTAEEAPPEQALSLRLRETITKLSVQAEREKLPLVEKYQEKVTAGKLTVPEAEEKLLGEWKPIQEKLKLKFGKEQEKITGKYVYEKTKSDLPYTFAVGVGIGALTAAAPPLGLITYGVPALSASLRPTETIGTIMKYPKASALTFGTFTAGSLIGGGGVGLLKIRKIKTLAETVPIKTRGAQFDLGKYTLEAGIGKPMKEIIPGKDIRLKYESLTAKGKTGKVSISKGDINVLIGDTGKGIGKLYGFETQTLAQQLKAKWILKPKTQQGLKISGKGLLGYKIEGALRQKYIAKISPEGIKVKYFPKSKFIKSDTTFAIQKKTGKGIGGDVYTSLVGKGKPRYGLDVFKGGFIYQPKGYTMTKIKTLGKTLVKKVKTSKEDTTFISKGLLKIKQIKKQQRISPQETKLRSSLKEVVKQELPSFTKLTTIKMAKVKVRESPTISSTIQKKKQRTFPQQRYKETELSAQFISPMSKAVQQVIGKEKTKQKQPVTQLPSSLGRMGTQEKYRVALGVASLPRLELGQKLGLGLKNIFKTPTTPGYPSLKIPFPKVPTGIRFTLPKRKTGITKPSKRRITRQPLKYQPSPTFVQDWLKIKVRRGELPTGIQSGLTVRPVYLPKEKKGKKYMQIAGLTYALPKELA